MVYARCYIVIMNELAVCLNYKLAIVLLFSIQDKCMEILYSLYDTQHQYNRKKELLTLCFKYKWLCHFNFTDV